MVEFVLRAKADLENVTDLEPNDTPDHPFEYSFKVICSLCFKEQENFIEANQYEKYQAPGHQGTFNLKFKCSECSEHAYARFERTDKKLQVGEKGKWCHLLNIDARGMDFVKFSPVGQWTCLGQNGRRFEDVNLESYEWSEFDDQMNQEVSVSELEFDIIRV